MNKNVFLVLVIVILSTPVFSQKHSITINNGLQKVGIYNNIQFIDEDDTPYPPNMRPIRGFKRMMSQFNRHTASITYNYQWHKNWRFMTGIRQTSKGYGLEQTVFYPSTKETKVFYDENYLPRIGLILGVENLILQKDRVAFGWQALLNPEIDKSSDFQGNKKYFGGMSTVLGLKSEVKIWKIKLIVNLFGEVGIVPYGDIFPTLNKFKPYGYGIQMGLSFNL